MEIIRPRIRLYAGIFRADGKLLVKRREKDESYFGDWSLPGGGIEKEFADKFLDERVVAQELARKVMKETGIDIAHYIQPMPALYPAILPVNDWAFAIIIGVVDEFPYKGIFKYVSPVELLELAQESTRNRLVGGEGKRMHRMCLRMLASRDSPNYDYRKEAGEMLKEIQRRW